MKKSIQKLTSLALISISSIFTVNQSQITVAQSTNSVMCQSTKGRLNNCFFDTSQGVILKKQLSNTSCQGNWLYGANFVQVKNGCRGEFISAGNESLGVTDVRKIVCGSRNSNTKRCDFETVQTLPVVLIQQLSNSPCEGNWGTIPGFIEVSNGCRAEFGYGFIP